MKIAIFTGTRAEYGLLRELVSLIHSEQAFTLQLIVTGAHLSKSYGQTLKEIEADGFTPSALVPLSLDSDEKVAMDLLAAEALRGVSLSLRELKSDILIVLGDRYEAFAAASAGHLNNIPVLHIHGGESTLGAIDNRLRHAISQLSTYHFAASSQYAQRIIDMGHPQKHVFNVGPMVLDNLRILPECSFSDFERQTGYKFGEKNIIVTYHPETLLVDKGLSGFRSLLTALDLQSCNVLFTYPNADAGREGLIEELHSFVELKRENRFVVPSLGARLYLTALRLFDCVVGNSSSGVIEAPLLGAPVLNIGERQLGRYQHGDVLNVSANINEILDGLRSLLNREPKSTFPRPLPSHLPSPAKSILEYLKSECLG